LNRRGAILFVHPSTNGICSPFINDYKFTAPVGTSLEDRSFVLHMIAKQIPHRYPNIRFIVPHLGGPIPCCSTGSTRRGRARATTRTSPRRHPSPPRNSITTRCATARRRGSAALEAFGEDHLVTGSDYPVLQDFESYTETSPISSASACRNRCTEQGAAPQRAETVRVCPLTLGFLYLH